MATDGAIGRIIRQLTVSIMAKTYSLFISHSWDHVDDLRNLRNLLENRGYFHVNFLETPPHDPINSINSTYVKSVIRNHIRNSNVVIGLAGVYASQSEWMRWELDTAIAEGIPVLGVIPWGQVNVSKVVQDRANEIVRWNTESIVEAIRRLGK